jgi:hypothetical protein
VRETTDQIWIAIEVPDIRSFPGTFIPAVLVVRRETVRLDSPVAGRAIAGPDRSPSWDRAMYRRIVSQEPPADTPMQRGATVAITAGDGEAHSE